MAVATRLGRGGSRPAPTQPDTLCDDYLGPPASMSPSRGMDPALSRGMPGVGGGAHNFAGRRQVRRSAPAFRFAHQAGRSGIDASRDRPPAT